MSSKKLITIGLIATAVVVLVVSAFLFRKDSLVVVPFSSPSVALHTYHEEGPVYSTITANHSDTGIVFKYTLSPVFPEPFAAIYWQDTIEPKKIYDASPYDMLSLRLHATKGTRIPITLRLSKRMIFGKDTVDMVPYVTVVDHHAKDTTYRIRLSSFKVPSWWLRLYKIQDTDIEQPDYSHIDDFVIGSCQALGPDIEDVITVSEVRFVHSNRTLLIVTGCVLSILIGIGLYIHLIRRQPVNSLQIAYTPLPVSETQNGEFGKIADFIAKNYPNAELSLTDVQNGVGINGKAISRLIKENLQISFTDYLNQLRITEVKRLLKETKLPISDIAYKVGYNNISHFNRVFKGITGKTPKAYREEGVQ